MNFWNILYPIEWVVSYVFYYAHEFLTFIGFSKGSGPAWPLSVILLVVIIRLIIFPLFLRQMHSMKKMQAIQPQIQAIQKKYKNKKDNESKQAMGKETMALYQKEGVNPAGSCLPMLLQMPIFLSLYRTFSSIKDIASGNREAVGPITNQVAHDIENSFLFGTHLHLSDNWGAAPDLPSKIVIGGLIAFMCVVMFINMRLISSKNTPQATKDSSQYNMTRSMMYIQPVIYIFTGIAFPVVILIYWCTTNLWNLGQGLFQLRFHPTPGSDAWDEKIAREKKKDIEKLNEIKETDPETYAEINKPDERKKQRQQPKKNKKKKG
ncbi:MAG: membrane protein insertase YidC [Candidatus Ancillula sp.]|jgi:YidC/Oxa1 family membrane protein insertase|nr:membrane protein insertase YidC [Candidatus Ancillula sp.]